MLVKSRFSKKFERAFSVPRRQDSIQSRPLPANTLRRMSCKLHSACLQQPIGTQAFSCTPRSNTNHRLSYYLKDGHRQCIASHGF